MKRVIFLNGDVISQLQTHKYLGVTFASHCSWIAHVHAVVAKATKALNFIERKLRSSPAALKNTSYNSVVRPITEYACGVWDRQQKSLIDLIERTQNQAVRFVLRWFK